MKKEVNFDGVRRTPQSGLTENPDGTFSHEKPTGVSPKGLISGSSGPKEVKFCTLCPDGRVLAGMFPSEGVCVDSQGLRYDGDEFDEYVVRWGLRSPWMIWVKQAGAEWRTPLSESAEANFMENPGLVDGFDFTSIGRPGPVEAVVFLRDMRLRRGGEWVDIHAVPSAYAVAQAQEVGLKALERAYVAEKEVEELTRDALHSNLRALEYKNKLDARIEEFEGEKFRLNDILDEKNMYILGLKERLSNMEKRVAELDAECVILKDCWMEAEEGRVKAEAKLSSVPVFPCSSVENMPPEDFEWVEGAWYQLWNDDFIKLRKNIDIHREQRPYEYVPGTGKMGYVGFTAKGFSMYDGHVCEKNIRRRVL